jgi:hypothetical protein
MLKKPPNTNNYNQTKPKKQSKPKTELKEQPPERLGCFFIQQQQPKKQKICRYSFAFLAQIQETKGK